MEIQYKLNIQGSIYDLVPNYPQEQKVDLEALNKVCAFLRQEQENNQSILSQNSKTSQYYHEVIQRLLRRKQTCIINSIHQSCYPKMLHQKDKKEEILFQYLMYGESLSLSQENREKILHFYTLIDSDIEKTLLSPYGAILLSDEKISAPLSRVLFEKQLSKETEMKTPLLSGRMLLLMREEYSKEVKEEILKTYDEEELKQESQKFTAFFRGLSLAKGLSQEEQSYLANEPFYEEYKEAKKVASSPNCSHLLRRAAKTMYFLETEIKKQEKKKDSFSYQKK